MSDNEEKTVKCPICGALYKLRPVVGDQSACPKCVREADINMSGPWRYT